VTKGTVGIAYHYCTQKFKGSSQVLIFTCILHYARRICIFNKCCSSV